MVSMNRLGTEKRRAVIACLVEGNSIRATVRMTGVAKNTVVKLLVDLGTACSDYQDRVMRDLPCKHIQADEIWTFCGSKAKNVPAEKYDDPNYGDVWTWVAIDSDTKLVPSYRVGARDLQEAQLFMRDVAKRLRHRVQLTTDAHRPYLTAVEGAFAGDVDYAQLIKVYGSDASKRKGGAAKYSPAVCLGSHSEVVTGSPDPAHVSTSHVERANLTMRMSMRRFTRLTNAFSKKLENLAAAVSLHFAHYNFCRVHLSLDGQTPAMAAGVTDHVWTLDELIGLLEAVESVPVKRGRYERTRTARRAATDSN